MKRTCITLCMCIICLFLSIPAYADEDCDLTLKDAKKAYDAGNYAQAKKLYDYVVTICGASYGNASSWSQRCQDALNPWLSVSNSNLSVGASSGTTSITVTSNRAWKLTNTNSSLFSVSRNGDVVSISYSSNSNTTTRSDYFDVVTTDGTKSVRVKINQAAKANATPYLTVNKTSISASSYGATEYLTVSCNTAWEVQFPTGNMYSVTRDGNTLTVMINANTSTESRTNFFYVKTKDGSIIQKVSLSQTGKSSSSSSSYTASAKINNIWVDHNIYKDGQKGMKIHINMNAYNLRSKACCASVYFYTESGTELVDTNGRYYTTNGKVSCWEDFSPGYDNTYYDDFILFMPYSELHITYKGSFKFFVCLWNKSVSPSKELVQSDWQHFTYTP